MTVTLERLFDRYRLRDDVSALAEVFDRTAPEVLRVATHFARDPAEAEELVQETFLTAMEAREDFDASRRIVPWLLGILQNRVRRRWRRVGRGRGGTPVGEPDRPADPAEPLANGELADRVLQAVDAQPEPYRAVLVLRLRHGLEPSAIAHALDRSPATVRTQLHRGLERLRHEIPEERRVGLAGVGLATVGLEGVRAQVLARAETLAAAAASSTTMAVGGALLMTKKLLLIAGAAVLLLGMGGYALGVFTEHLGSTEEKAPTVTQVVRAPAESPAPPRLQGSDARAAPPVPTPAVVTGDSAASIEVEAEGPQGPVVTGTLRFTDGTPAAGLEVCLRGGSDVVTTDAEGAFRVVARYLRHFSLSEVGSRSMEVSLGPVSVESDAPLHVDLTIDTGVTVETVVRERETGDPVPDARLTLRRPGSHTRNVLQGGYATQMSDAEGRFRIPHLPRSVYTVEIYEKGFEPLALQVDLREAPFPRELLLAPTRVLAIRLKGAPEAAVGAEIQWMLDRMGGEGRVPFSMSGKTAVDEDGCLRIDAPPKGLGYHVLLFKSEHLPRLEQWSCVIPGGPTPEIEIAVPASGSVRGVLRALDGAPLGGRRVAVGGARPVETDAEGTFFLPAVSAGAQDVRIRLPRDSHVVVGRLDVPVSGELRPVVTVPGDGVLAGRLRVEDASSPGMLMLYDAGARVLAAVHPRQGEAFEIPFLAAGTYRLRGWAKHAERWEQEVIVGRGERVDVGEICVRGHPRVLVTLHLPTGAEPPVRIHVGPTVSREPGAYWGGQIERATGGRWWLKGVPVGTHELQFQAKGFRRVVRTVTVAREPGPPLELDLTLAEGDGGR